MAWPPTHAKTAKLEITHTLANDRQVTYIYTNEGHRRDGVWEVTGEEWTEGTCIVEFRRVCGSAPVVVEEDDLGVPEFYVEDLASKARAFLEDRAYDLDISSKTLRDVDVQDTDFAYRPRIVYDDARAYGQDSAWSVVGGSTRSSTAITGRSAAASFRASTSSASSSPPWPNSLILDLSIG